MDPSATGLEATAARNGLLPVPGRPRPGSSQPLDSPDLGDVDDAGPDACPPALTVVGSFDSLDNAALAGLIGRVMRQDAAALAVRHDPLYGRVHAVAMRITHQVACADEVLQESFWRAWRQASRFDPQRASANAWVLMMARSRALDARLSRARNPVQTSRQSVDDDAIANQSGLPRRTVKSRCRRTLAHRPFSTVRRREGAWAEAAILWPQLGQAQELRAVPAGPSLEGSGAPAHRAALPRDRVVDPRRRPGQPDLGAGRCAARRLLPHLPMEDRQPVHRAGLVAHVDLHAAGAQPPGQVTRLCPRHGSRAGMPQRGASSMAGARPPLTPAAAAETRRAPWPPVPTNP